MFRLMVFSVHLDCLPDTNTIASGIHLKRLYFNN
jgi:hypothetical protein